MKNSHGNNFGLLCPLAMLADLEEQMDAIPLPKPTEGVTKPGRYLVTTTETHYFLSKYFSNDWFAMFLLVSFVCFQLGTTYGFWKWNIRLYDCLEISLGHRK